MRAYSHSGPWRFVFLLVAACVVLGSSVAQAQYTTTTANGAITITGYTGAGGVVTIPSTINSLPVTTIGISAFEASAVTSITIPTSVTSIGEAAFENCTSLTSVTIPTSITSLGVEAFYGCTSLTSVTIPASVTSIADDAFSSCTSLTSVTIGNGVTSIGEAAFDECTSLTSISIPNSVTSIGEVAFFGCSGLTTVTIGNGLTSIADFAFDACTNLTSVYFAGNVPTADSTLFENDTKVTVTVYYLPGAIGWGSTFAGVPAMLTPSNELGSLQVSITPAGAVTAGAQWQVDGGPLQNSGATVANLLVGTHTVSFSTISGYTTPGNQIISVTANSTATTSGAYASLAGSGSLQVTITPLAAVTAGAQWRVDGGTLQNSGATVANLSVGSHTVSFSTISGYTTPANQIISITANATTTAGGAYALQFTTTTNGDGSLNISAYTGPAVAVTIPSTINGVAVTSIGTFAFNDAGITSVTIPASVTSIGIDAFENCFNLTAINVTAGNPDYSSVNGVLFNQNQTTLVEYPGGVGGSYTIPSSVTTIGSYAFEDCGSLTSVTIPTSVTSIGEFAFVNTSLASVTIPNSVTSLGQSAFEQCPSLTSVTIGSGVTSIGNEAFATCANLTSVTISNGVTSIGGGAFDGCVSLASIAIPNSVTSIGAFAFESCTALATVTIGTGVTSIADDAFDECTNLTGVYFSGNVPTADTTVFTGDAKVTAYRLSGASGWGSTFAGVPVVLYSVVATGSLQVTITPAAAITAGAQWQVDGGTLQNSGATVANLSVGAHTVSFSAINGYTTPANQIISVTANSTATGAYVLIPFTFTTANGAITITGYTGSSSVVSIPSTINGLPVTSIGLSAFFNDASITSVTIPNSVTSIGEAAFEGCTSVASVTIGNSVTSIGDDAFSDCESLTSIIIPNSVTAIGGGAFQYTGLTSVTIPDSVTVIGVQAFVSCTSLTSITIGNSVTSIQFAAFDGCTSLTSIVIPNSVTDLGSGVMFSSGAVFAGCTSLASVTIGTGVTSILNNMFVSCTSLTSVVIPTSVTSIGQGVFDQCTSLPTITIPASVTSIGLGAFLQCTSMTAINVATGNPDYSSVNGVLFNQNQTTLVEYPGGLAGSYTIPSSVTSIAENAFSGCAKLTSLTIPNSVTSLGDGAFNGSSLTSIIIGSGITSFGGCTGCTSLASVTIPASVTSIQSEAFEGCSSLTSLTIPASVTSIGSYAFDSCTNLTSLTISTSVTSIGNYAFESCTSLTSLTIPSSVTSVGDYAFESCTNLTSVYFTGNAPGADTTAFYDDTAVTVYYYAGASGWSSPFAGVPAVMLNQPPPPPPPPIITTQPASAVVVAGASATFTVAASGTGTPAYQWQVSTDGGTTWNNVSGSAYSGATTATLTITTPATTLLGDQFRAVITNSGGGTIDTTPVPLIVGTSSAKLTWLQNNFTSAELGNPAMVGDLATPAGDGIPNLIKYAFNLSPLANGQSSLPAPQIVNGQLSLTFPAPQSDLTYTVEASTDLINWSATGVTTQTNGTQMTASYTTPAGAAAFLRIVVAPAP